MKIKLHYPEGMKLHGDNACKYLGFEKYDWKTDKNKPTMFWLYTEDDYKYLASHQGKKYVCWCGSDVLHFANTFAGKYVNVVRDTSITHVCLNDLMQAELAQMGIHAMLRYIFLNDPLKYQPQTKFTKDAYLSSNPGRGAEYGEHLINAIAWQFPKWNFHIFGLDPIVQVYCDNVKYYGWIPEDEMDATTKNFGVCFRLNMHDGFPQVVCKALLRGQQVITRIPYHNLTICTENYEKMINAFEWIDKNFEAINKDTLVKESNVRDMINNFDFIV